MRRIAVRPICKRGLSMKDKVIDYDTRILGTTPVFSGTRVPIRILIEYLEAGDRLDDFLENHPTVSRNQAIEVLERTKDFLQKPPRIQP